MILNEKLLRRNDPSTSRSHCALPQSALVTRQENEGQIIVVCIDSAYYFTDKDGPAFEELSPTEAESEDVTSWDQCSQFFYDCYRMLWLRYI